MHTQKYLAVLLVLTGAALLTLFFPTEAPVWGPPLLAAMWATLMQHIAEKDR